MGGNAAAAQANNANAANIDKNPRPPPAPASAAPNAAGANGAATATNVDVGNKVPEANPPTTDVGGRATEGGAEGTTGSSSSGGNLGRSGSRKHSRTRSPTKPTEGGGNAQASSQGDDPTRTGKPTDPPTEKGT